MTATIQPGDRVLTPYGTGNVVDRDGYCPGAIQVRHDNETVWTFTGNTSCVRVISRLPARVRLTPGYVSPHYSEMVEKARRDRR